MDLSRIKESLSQTPAGVERKTKSALSRIVEGLYLGSAGTVTHKSFLQELGITHILNVSEELLDLEYPPDLSLAVSRVPLHDRPSQDLAPYLSPCIDYVHQVIQDGGCIAVHCIAGVSRSASVCIAYLVRYGGLSLKDAFTHVQRCRPCVFPNTGFWQCLLEFEEAERGERSLEMLPFYHGLVPSLWRQEAENRVWRGWMDRVCLWWLGMAVLFLASLAWDWRSWQ